MSAVIRVAQVMSMEGTRHSAMVMLLTGSWSLVLPGTLLQGEMLFLAALGDERAMTKITSTEIS